SGRLPQALRLGARLFDRQAKTRQKILSALTYPFFILTLGLIGILIMMLVVLPELAPMLQGQGNEKIEGLFQFADWIEAYGWMIPLLIAAVISLVFSGTKNQSLNAFVSKAMLRMPFLGQIIVETNFGATAQCLSALLSGGVSASRAFSLASIAAKNPYIKEEIIQAGHRLANGNTVAGTLQEIALAPTEISRLAVVGEKTGALAPMLGRAGDIMLDRAEQRLDKLVSMVGPAMIIILGLGAGSAMSSILGALSSIGDGVF
ncbi:MAG: type II secretion system F family protein, partial [Phycisphaeraceae bacterium]|nr:type II secretion system F family protein [Phycisphaeraceae bacterium]